MQHRQVPASDHAAGLTMMLVWSLKLAKCKVRLASSSVALGLRPNSCEAAMHWPAQKWGFLSAAFTTLNLGME